MGASEEDSAYETGESLAPSAVADRLDPVADRDFLWASAIAAFAEILKDSPYADIAHLDAIEEIVRAQATRDEERTRFERHFQRARVFLAGG